jgi:mannitol/fructose-specific phosphotransferase system IIA component (Ntr-type)
LHVLEEWLRELSGESPQGQKALQDDELLTLAVAADAGNQQRNVLNELIGMLMRKQILTDAEGEELLRKLTE